MVDTSLKIEKKKNKLNQLIRNTHQERSRIAHVHVLEMKMNVQKLVGLFFKDEIFSKKKQVLCVLW